MKYQCVVNLDMKEFESECITLLAIVKEAVPLFSASTWPAQIHLFKNGNWQAKFDVTSVNGVEQCPPHGTPRLYHYDVDGDIIEFMSTSEWSADPDGVVEDAAEHYDQYADSDWPITFTMYCKDCKEIGKYKVEREYYATFSARKL